MPNEALNANVSMSLTCSDLPRSMHFYVEGLGFEIERMNEVDGVLRFATLKAGDSQLSIGRDDFAKGRDRNKGVGMRIWINTAQDVVGIANRAKAAGIALESEPAPLPWGPMAFTVKDPDGFAITVSSAG